MNDFTPEEIQDMQLRLFILAKEALPNLARNLHMLDEEEVYDIADMIRYLGSLTIRVLEIEELEIAFAQGEAK
jgi:hypothetical protein